jgi:ADP-ribose pyrophosphatase YjhB (NUDIX family)
VPADEETQVPFRCAGCGFVLFFNPVVGVAALVRRADGSLLFLRRAKEPARGKLGVPGGFVDFGETAEAALRREAIEETGLRIDNIAFLCSFPNDYAYQGVTYGVLDFYFTASIDAAQSAEARDEVESVVWLKPAEVDPAELCFPSLRHALRAYRERGGC